MVWSNGTILGRRIDDIWFTARIVEIGDPEATGNVGKIEYLDDKKTEEEVPMIELSDAPECLTLPIKDDKV